MTEYLFERHPDGTYDTFEYDDATGDVRIRRYADVQSVIDSNRSYHLESDGKGRDAWLAARIPEFLVDEWLKTKGVNARRADHWPEVRKLLNDPDWKHLRPTSFKL
jgi:hypothetical protein